MMGRAPQSVREKNGYGKGWRDGVAQLGPAGQRTLGPLLAFKGPRVHGVKGPRVEGPRAQMQRGQGSKGPDAAAAATART
jgi:hypothetical protein